MIRINLLAGERRAAKTAGRSMQIGQKITVVGSLIVIVTMLLIGWRYWALDQQQSQLVHDIETARREETRLAEVLRDVGNFEAQGVEFERRVALINELRRGQNAPVHMIDQVSRALPEMTWLTSIRQDGYDLTIQGRSTTLSAVSDFVSSLENTRYFSRPVEIIDSQVVAGQQEAPDLIQFTIRGTFQMAGIEKPAPPPTKKGGKVG